MSRGGKAGLDYFPVDIDIFEDEKIELVSAKYGLISELIVVKLLTRIYRNGYFMEWGDDIAYLFAKKFGDGITKDLLDNVVTELINKTFFNEQRYVKYSILTSKGIQRVYVEATKRRKSIDMYREFLLLEKKDVDILNQNVNIIGLNVDIYKQSKVKESKEKVKEREKESSKDILSGKPDDIPYKKIITKEKSPKKFDDNSDEIRLSKLLYSLILERNLNQKYPNLQKWAYYIDLMIRRDNRDPENIKRVIEWCQADNILNQKGFCWANNVISTNKLREQYDQLFLKMVGNKRPKWQSGIEEWLRIHNEKRLDPKACKSKYDSTEGKTPKWIKEWKDRHEK